VTTDNAIAVTAGLGKDCKQHAALGSRQAAAVTPPDVHCIIDIRMCLRAQINARNQVP